ncbi:MAG TPA: tetratricopeptide repeat protein [Planctomycetota bacterium]|nr:tetratricopeptide repeat protein [Planctomycetota bacterium]
MAQKSPAVVLLFIVGCVSVPAGPDVQQAKACLEEGRAQAREGDHAAAVASYTRALQAHPEFSEAYYERGYAHLQMRIQPGAEENSRSHETRALEDYSMAIRYNPAFADAFFNRAMILSSRAQYKQAVEDLLNACRYKPNDAECHFYLGQLYEDKFEGKAVLAMNHYEKYVALGGTDATVREKVKLWQELKKQAAAPPPAKAPGPEDEKKAAELHERFKELFGAGKKDEAVRALEDLLSKYEATQYVQSRGRELRAVYNALKK